jgi:hypothetical protein
MFLVLGDVPMLSDTVLIIARCRTNLIGPAVTQPSLTVEMACTRLHQSSATAMEALMATMLRPCLWAALHDKVGRHHAYVVSLANRALTEQTFR